MTCHPCYPGQYNRVDGPAPSRGGGGQEQTSWGEGATLPTQQIILTAVGYAVPILAAPIAVVVLRRLFAVFLTEGTELFADFSLEPDDARAVGSLMAKFNVFVLLLAWLALFTCMCFNQPHYLLLGIALAGVLSAILISILIVRSNLKMQGGTMMMVGILSFAGGNLPIIVIVSGLMVLYNLMR